jgi:hypothetical protein
VAPRRHWAIISLDDASPRRSVRPTRNYRETSSLSPSADGFVPYLVLLPAGVTWPFTLLWMPVVSYTTFSPSPAPSLPSPKSFDLGEGRGWGSGCLFLWPYSGRLAPCGGFPPRMLSDAVLYGVRTFLDPDTRDRDRPTDLRKYYHTRERTERQHQPGNFKQSFKPEIGCRHMWHMHETSGKI